jgi:Metal-dependent amidase/aminoacylase/carboxypeptidase
VAALRQHIRPTERVHGIFTKAGEKPNIVPRESEMNWYVRSDTIETLQPLKQRVAACLESSAAATDCRAELQWEINAYADIVDNIPLLDAYAANSTDIGRPLTSAILPGTGVARPTWAT